MDLQIFGVEGLEGIDEDIQKEIEKESKPIEENQENTTSDNADADSDKKQVEEETKQQGNLEEEKQEEESDKGNIPYSRFKSVNEKRKTAELENAELKKKLEEYERKEKSVEQKEAEKPKFKADGYNQEQMEKITAYAIEQVKKDSNLSDEDVDAIRYGDDQTKLLAFNKTVQNKIDKVVVELEKHRKAEEDYKTQNTETAKEFENLNQKLLSYPDSDERIKYITQTAYEQLPERKKRVLSDAFARLQNKVGVYSDMELIQEYFEKENKNWEKSNEKQATHVATKFEKAQGLPKAPNINGGASADVHYTLDDIREAIESNDSKRWDDLPENIKKGVLNGTLKL